MNILQEQIWIIKFLDTQPWFHSYPLFYNVKDKEYVHMLNEIITKNMSLVKDQFLFWIMEKSCCPWVEVVTFGGLMGCPRVYLWPFLAERLSTIHLVGMIKRKMSQEMKNNGVLSARSYKRNKYCLSNCHRILMDNFVALRKRRRQHT